MSNVDNRFVLSALDPTAKPWSGSPSPAGSLRSVSLEMAIRRINGLKRCIWELALHIAYWEYAVRRMLEQGPTGGFLRSPSNWPALPAEPTEQAWNADRRLVKHERAALLEAARTVDTQRLREKASPRSKHSTADVLSGIIQHSAHHTGQIALLKRLHPSSDAGITTVDSWIGRGK